MVKSDKMKVTLPKLFSFILFMKCKPKTVQRYA